MFYSLVTCFNIFFFLSVFIFLFRKIKSEAGGWTSFVLVFLLFFLVFNRNKDLRLTSNQKEYVFLNKNCEDCLIKRNKIVSIKNNLGLFTSLTNELDIYTPPDTSKTLILKKEYYLLGLIDGAKWKEEKIEFKKNNYKKLDYKIKGILFFYIFGFIDCHEEIEFNGSVSPNENLVWVNQ